MISAVELLGVQLGLEQRGLVQQLTHLAGQFVAQQKGHQLVLQ